MFSDMTEAHRARIVAEKALFACLDLFLDEPSDANLTTLQDLRLEHKKRVEEVLRMAAEQAPVLSTKPAVELPSMVDIEKNLKQMREESYRLNEQRKEDAKIRARAALEKDRLKKKKILGLF